MIDHIPLKLTVTLAQPVRWYTAPLPYDRHALTNALTNTNQTGKPTQEYTQYCARVTEHCQRRGLGQAQGLVYDELEDCMNEAAAEVFPTKKIPRKKRTGTSITGKRPGTRPG